MKPVANVQSNIVATDEQDPVVGIGEDHSVLELLVNQLLQPTQNEIPSEDRVNRPTAVGPVCFSCGGEGHGINRCSRMNAAFPFLPSGWSVNMNNGQYRATRIGKTSTDFPGNEEWSGREGQPPGPSEIKAPLTLVGGSVGPSNGTQWRMPAGRNKGRHWAADSQEFPGLGTPSSTVWNTKESNCSAGPSTAEMDRLPTASPTPVFRKSDRGMRPAQEIRPTPHKDIIERIRGVMKTIAMPLSVLADNFTPRKTSRKSTTSRVPTDSELDRSLSRTGPGKIENPHDIIEIDTAMIGAAYPTEMNKPVAMADVAGASGPAVTGAGGPVVAGTRFLAVAEVYSPVREVEGDPQTDDRKVEHGFSTPEEEVGSHTLEQSSVEKWAGPGNGQMEISPLEHSGVITNSAPIRKLVEWEPLEHSVFDFIAPEEDVGSHPLEHSGVEKWAGPGNG